MGLIPIIIIKGILTATQINVMDILVVSLFSLICVVPFIQFVRGVMRS